MIGKIAMKGKIEGPKFIEKEIAIKEVKKVKPVEI